MSPINDEITQEETTPGKHLFKLEDISLISTNRNNNNGQQTLNVPWLNSQSSSSRGNWTPRGASPRTSRRGRMTLAQMNPTRNQSLSSALEANPIPQMNTPATADGNPPQDQEE